MCWPCSNRMCCWSRKSLCQIIILGVKRLEQCLDEWSRSCIAHQHAFLEIPTGVWYSQLSRKSTNSRDMNYSKKIFSNEDYDDTFEPLTVFHSSSVIEASCFIKATI